MDAQKLTYFLAAAHTQNFRRAAELCHVAQPVLGRQIAALEQELGVTLFERQGKRVALTPAGAAFIPHARSILAGIQAGRQALESLRESVEGRLEIGCIEPLAAALLPPAFAAFQSRYPQVRVSVTVSGTEELFGMLERGNLELGLFGLAPERMRPHPLLALHELYHDRLALFLAPGHPLAAAGAVSFGQVAAERLALLNARFAMRRILERIFAQHNLPLSPALEIDNVATLKLIVHRGGISTILPQSLLAPEDEAVGMVALPIRDVTDLFTFALVYRLDGRLSPPAQGFIRAATESLSRPDREGEG